MGLGVGKRRYLKRRVLSTLVTGDGVVGRVVLDQWQCTHAWAKLTGT